MKEAGIGTIRIVVLNDRSWSRHLTEIRSISPYVGNVVLPAYGFEVIEV